MGLLKTAIIGTGHIAQTVHIPGFIAASGSEITAICSRDIDRAKDVANQFAIAASFDSVETMLNECRPDVVVVCTPNAFHHQVVLQSLRAGCHVFCEKPPATSLAHAVEMEQTSLETRRTLAYNFPLRQKPEVDIIKQKIAEDFFGTIYHINASFLRRRGIPAWGNFTNKEIQGGGALIDIGIHILDLALHIIGFPELKKVLASTYDHIGKQGGSGTVQWDHHNFSVEDACFAQLNFKNNTSISLQAAFALNSKKDRIRDLEIFGSKAGAFLSPLELYTDRQGELEIVEIAVEDTDIQQLSIQKFIAACEGDATNICTAHEGTLLQEMVERLYLSAMEN
jgi:predicted dehydrogenase